MWTDFLNMQNINERPHNKALKATGNKRFLFFIYSLSPCALVSSLSVFIKETTLDAIGSLIVNGG